MKRLESRSPSAFTLVEVLISSAILTIVAAGVYAIFTCSNILTTKITAINTTSTTIQNALDRIQLYLQQSYTTAYPLAANGAILPPISISGATAYSKGMIPVVMGASGEVTGTGVGIKFYRYVNGPYLAKIPTTGLPSNASSITLYACTGANSICSAITSPQAGDVLLINTTALLGDTSYQVWANVSGTGPTTTVNGTTQYTVYLNGTLRSRQAEDKSGVPASISYMYDYAKGTDFTWATYLLRPTAFLISYRNSRTELGLLEPCVTTGSTVNTGSNYTTLATLSSGSSPILSGTAPYPFSIVSFYGNTFVSVTLQTKADADAYLTGKQATNGFSTYMGVSSMIHLQSKPF